MLRRASSPAWLMRRSYNKQGGSKQGKEKGKHEVLQLCPSLAPSDVIRQEHTTVYFDAYLGGSIVLRL
jgi:hypothetical protein